jgi:hypothetical protein
VSWFPFVALWPLMSICSYECVSEKLYIASFWLSYLNSLFTPLVLLYNNAKYRKSIYVLIARLSCSSSSPCIECWCIRSWLHRFNRHRKSIGSADPKLSECNVIATKSGKPVTGHTAIDMDQTDQRPAQFRCSLNHSSSFTNATNHTNGTSSSSSFACSNAR